MSPIVKTTGVPVVEVLMEPLFFRNAPVFFIYRPIPAILLLSEKLHDANTA
jgi:hypothetical protein